MSYKSNLNPSFRSKFSEDIFNFKYKHEGAETWETLSRTLVEDVCCNHMTRDEKDELIRICLLYTSPSPRDLRKSRMPSSA